MARYRSIGGSITMARILEWPDILLEAIYCGANQKETAAVRKLLINEPLNKTDVHHLIGLVVNCPINRLDSLEIQEFEDHLMTQIAKNNIEAIQ